MENVILNNLDDHIRVITDAECAHYHEHGWVKLDGLISTELATQMRRAALQPRDDVETTGSWEQMAHSPGIEPFRSVFFHERMGSNASRLINRVELTDETVPLLYRMDSFVKRDPGPMHTPFHQDSVEHGSDRGGELQFWMALTEVTPEMGAMRFLDGSFRAGPLGSVFRGGDEPDLVQLYPKLLQRYPYTEPFHYQPGDATVHHGYTVHGAPPNRTDRSRMSYIYAYSPADTRWPEGKMQNWGQKTLPLTDHTLNPVAYPVTLQTATADAR